MNLDFPRKRDKRRQPDIMGDKQIRVLQFLLYPYSRQPDIVGDKINLDGLRILDGRFNSRQSDIVGDKESFARTLICSKIGRQLDIEICLCQ